MITVFVFTLIGFYLGRLSKHQNAQERLLELRIKGLKESVDYYQKVLDEKDLCIQQLTAKGQTVKAV